MKQQNLPIFVKCDLLVCEKSCEILREYLTVHPTLKKYTKICSISNDEVTIEGPPKAYDDVHVDNHGLCVYSAEALIRGYIELTIESLKILLGLPT